MEKIIRTVILAKDDDVISKLEELFYFWPVVNIKVEVVGVASSPEEALDLARRKMPDLVVVGWDIEIITGLRMAAQCQKEEYNFKFILLDEGDSGLQEAAESETSVLIVATKDCPGLLMKEIERLFQ